MPREPSELTDHIGYWMRLISNHVSTSFARKIELSGVTVAEWVILRKMYGNGVGNGGAAGGNNSGGNNSGGNNSGGDGDGDKDKGKSERTSPSQIAELTGLTRGAVSKLVSRLSEKGLANRNESSGDRRYQHIELTTKGVSLVPKLATLADQNDDKFFSVLSKADRVQLKALLRKLASRHEITTAPTE